jgi:hypothetical protein
VELRLSGGAYVPTGAQRNVLNGGPAVGAQVALPAADNLHFLLGMGWVSASSRLAMGEDDVDLWNLDGGAEVNAARSLSETWELRPFLAAGVGVRIYDFADAATASTRCLAGYMGAGTEFVRSRVVLRAEARDYLSCSASPPGEKKSARNDLLLTVGVSFHAHGR